MNQQEENEEEYYSIMDKILFITCCIGLAEVVLFLYFI